MKKIMLILTTICVSLSFLPSTVSASERKQMNISGDAYQIEQLSNTDVVIHNLNAGTSDAVHYDENKIFITENDGTERVITFDEKGNAYENGVLISEVTEIENETTDPSNRLNARSSNGGYVYAGTVYTKRSFYHVSISTAISIVGFVPGFGNIATAAGIVYGLWSSGQRELYYKITSYSNGMWMKKNCSTYKYSNYTGHLGTTYGHPFRINW